MLLRSENLLPLTGGAYQARSYIADKEICENLFPEINPREQETPAPVTHYPREGKRPLSSPPSPGPGRGLFTLSNGNLFAVVGNSVYYIDTNWNWNLLGKISNLSTPASMADNGTTAVLVDGTPNGYTVNLATNAFAVLEDPTGTFVGSRRVDFADTYLAFAAPGTNRWYLALSDQVVFNALVQANKDSFPDPIQTHIFNLRQAWLLGSQTTEIWWLSGNTPFPYQEWPTNIFVPYGCAAPYSLVQADVDIFWLSENAQGQKIALKSNGYGAMAFSTRALEFEWTGYQTVADCIGGTFQQAGHTFVIFHFPSADRTWAFDLSTRCWHRRTWTDNNGIAHREKTAFYASVGASGKYPSTIVGQDWQTGQIYALDPAYYADNQSPIVCRRSFPHSIADMHFITHTAFIADFETGGIEGFGETEAGNAWSSGFDKGFGPFSPTWGGNGPNLCMRYSNDGGNTWSNYRQKALVSSGHYRSMMRYRGLGMARDRIYELMWAYPGPSALQGAYLEEIKHAA